MTGDGRQEKGHGDLARGWMDIVRGPPPHTQAPSSGSFWMQPSTAKSRDCFPEAGDLPRKCVTTQFWNVCCLFKTFKKNTMRTKQNMPTRWYLSHGFSGYKPEITVWEASKAKTGKKQGFVGCSREGVPPAWGWGGDGVLSQVCSIYTDVLSRVLWALILSKWLPWRRADVWCSEKEDSGLQGSHFLDACEKLAGRVKIFPC